ncbi:hypothetical protein DEO72_LG6g758 [Vigna unguiculata]|uniref:Uncharacterized protein n=1 Tax=Vigna unguiculata TaxID=3917 RepID=A0A4D6M7G1_VIGUN|nr:hypothetical protein DEO72_LG6g758 [Vigna unguiculata]
MYIHMTKTVWPTTDLAQARSPHLGERSAFAQAADSRLGEITTVGGFVNARLGKAISPQQDHPSLKVEVPRLGQNYSDMSSFPRVLA